MDSYLQNKLSRCNRNKSFTLLEAVFVLTIVSISLLTLIKSFSLIAQADSTIKDYTQAMFLLKSKLCELKIKGFGNSRKEGRFNTPFDKFYWHLNREDLSADTAKVDLSVFWGRGSRERKLKIFTCLGKDNS